LSTPDLTYTAQFEVLRVWIGNLLPAEWTSPSVLPGWTVADLVAHLSGTAASIAALSLASDDAEPMTVGAYVRSYAAESDAIGQLARDTNEAAGQDLLAELDAAHAAADQRLAELGGADRVVVSRRGPILLWDFLATRLIELVVHSGDLARSLPGRKGPTVLPSAQRSVLAVLRELLTEKAGSPVEALAAASMLEPAQFIELAAGRRRPPDGLAPALSEALPLF
jgi:uncharacterized protein (TIGR03083 family)